tara:strand:+ start:6151 stop:7254 length:1104 start_codon:yes stop_codon:yes gene_type:complete
LKNTLFRDDSSLLGANWYKLSKKLFVIPFILSFVGLLAIYSLIGTEYPLLFLIKHILYLIISIFILIFISLLGVNDLKKLLNLLAIISITLLFLVPFLGHSINGATRWINFNFFSIQPSEILKGPAICMISWFYYLYSKTNKISYLLINFMIMFVIVALLLLQPDIGTLLIYLCSFSLILILYTRKIKLFFLLGILGLVFIVISYYSFSHVHLRVDNFLFNENSQVSKSLSAIKEGGLFGVGLGEGQLKYSIPESHNDFIFAILVEEFGLIFGLFIALLYPIFFIISKKSLINPSNLFLQNTIFCLCFVLCLQAFINIASSIDLIPPTGMTLPLISYGGSSMLSYALIFGTVICFSKNEENSTNHPS